MERGAGPAPASGVGQPAAVPDEVYGRHGEGPRQGDCPNAKEEHEGGQAAAHRWTHEGNGQGESENGTAAADPENSGDCEEKGRRRKGATGEKMEGEDTADTTPQTGEAGGEAVQGGLELEEGPGGDAVARGAPDTVSTGAERGAAVGEGAVGVAGAAEACAGSADIMPRKTAGKAGAGAAGIGRRRARGAGGKLAAGACRKSEGGVNEAARQTRKDVHPGTAADEWEDLVTSPSGKTESTWNVTVPGAAADEWEDQVTSPSGKTESTWNVTVPGAPADKWQCMVTSPSGKTESTWNVTVPGAPVVEWKGSEGSEGQSSIIEWEDGVNVERNGARGNGEHYEPAAQRSSG
ncbi:spidroin-1-like [Drosophila bipectinata]|uniref:spidroin-1-like n=1 Tax=Drosophila bipectinata TaxID=42026 RepID=UPI0038B269DB